MAGESVEWSRVYWSYKIRGRGKGAAHVLPFRVKKDGVVGKGGTAGPPLTATQTPHRAKMDGYGSVWLSWTQDGRGP